MDLYGALGVLAYDPNSSATQSTILICDAHRQRLDGRASELRVRAPVRHQVLGIAIEVDDAVPRNEVWLVNRRREVVKIVNLEP